MPNAALLTLPPPHPTSTSQANGADIKGGTWFETGAEMLNGGTLNYFAVPFGVVGNPLPLVAVTAVEVVLMGAVEKFRSDGTGPAGFSPGQWHCCRRPGHLRLPCVPARLPSQGLTLLLCPRGQGLCRAVSMMLVA